MPSGRACRVRLSTIFPVMPKRAVTAELLDDSLVFVLELVFLIICNADSLESYQNALRLGQLWHLWVVAFGKSQRLKY